ncbi:MAG TPA: acetyl-CoA C-acyltransferase [Deltaproteobacteria bacterium]|nr:acetyl-CoA C-acyltransferase [Deltaproteobacteria bacterium]HPR54275.1 acetyl-CoA C-acyltransferase [Deltaproteobacteria bacterium]HXK45813.1 acetyl-CoA C-acyltransferase [Deltaproteobacteria bacterium]
MSKKMDKSKSGKRIAVIDGCRVPFQRSGTGYYDVMAWELGRYAVKGLLAKTGVSPEDIDHVLMGCVASDIATTNVAREVALGAGIPKGVPAHTCTIACVSANAAFTNGSNLIETGNAEIVVIGGVESFSDVPIKVSKRYRRFILDMTMYHKPKRFTDTLRHLKGMKFMDFIVPERPAVSEYSTGLLMGQTAEILAKRLGITRREQDEFAVLSHQRALRAQEEGIFRKEIIPVVVPGKDKAIIADNGPKKDTTMDKVVKLKGSFDKKYGSVTAANSSFLTDGGSAVLIMSEEKAKELGLKPKAFLTSYAYTGQDLVEELLLGPAFSIPAALGKAGLKLSDIGVFEIHEAFASQMIGNVKCLASKEFARDRLGLDEAVGEIDFDKINRYGGSLSLGHPFGATGGRLITTCVNRMIDEDQHYGVVAGCGAGALGNAIIFENANA